MAPGTDPEPLCCEPVPCGALGYLTHVKPEGQAPAGQPRGGQQGGPAEVTGHFVRAKPSVLLRVSISRGKDGSRFTQLSWL